jgi:hypothetical protein
MRLGIGPAYYVGTETAWLYVNFDDVFDTLDLIGGVVLVSAALCQLVRGVLQ